MQKIFNYARAIVAVPFFIPGILLLVLAGVIGGRPFRRAIANSSK